MVLALVLIAAAGLPSLRDRQDDTLDVAARGGGAFRPGWAQLPQSPLGLRTGATAATIGDDIVVAGGTRNFCPAVAGCLARDDPGLTSGAAFRLGTQTWRSIAPAPVGFRNVEATVVGGAMFLFTWQRCLPACDGSSPLLLRYRPALDVWDVRPTPSGLRGYALAAAGDGLVAYASGSDPGAQTDWRLDLANNTWSQLPDDPLPPVVERQVVVAGDDLLLFGTRSNTHGLGPPPVVGARLDAATGNWTELPQAPSPGTQAWAIDGRMVLIPMGAGLGAGGVFVPGLAPGASFRTGRGAVRRQEC